jgi:hypothetical protein
MVPSRITHPGCPGESNGSIAILEPTGGEGPYTYLWFNGETSSSISGLPAGMYSVIVTDNTGCSRELFFGVTDPQPITASAQISNDQCNAEGFFEINLTPSGGTLPYTYQWSDGSTSQDRELLPSGTYSVVITDAKDCSIEKEMTIEADSIAWSCLITPLQVMPVCGSAGNILLTTVPDATYLWTVASPDSGWSISAGNTNDSVTFMAGGINTSATFTLMITKDGCTKTCSYTLSGCLEDSTGGEDPGGEDPGSGNETCEECFTSAIAVVEQDAFCYDYEVVVSTNGNCRHDLSHWDVEIPCGTISNLWNSAGWKMEIGKDPTTGLSGLKIDDISGFGKADASFTVRFSVCYENGCNETPGNWSPVVAYKAGLCVGYDSLTLNTPQTMNFGITAYPNPFSDKINFSLVSQEEDYGKLEILDQFGYPVDTPFQGDLHKGEAYTFEWPASRHKTGIYYYKLTTRSKTWHGKIFKN